MVDSEPPAPGWERVAHHAHLHVLPAVGAVSLTLGGLAAVGVGGEIPRILPVALIIAGSSSIVGSLASHLCLPRAEETPAPEAKAPPAPAPEVVAPSQAPATRGPARSRSGLRPHSGIGRATLAELAHMEDELWRRWASPHAASLGAPLVGPVPETAYSPSRAGAYAPFADRDRDVVMPSGASRPTDRASPSARRPMTSDNLRPPVSPKADISISPSRAAFASSGREVGNPGGFAGVASPLLSGRSGELFDMDSLDHPAYLASINPILPRLGPSGSRAGNDDRREHSPGVRSTHRGGICSECSRRLLDFRAWVECRICRRPLCRGCLQESFSTGDAGSCSDCRATRTGSASGRRGERREATSVARWAHS
jgi:hypothetical protein